MGTLKISPSMMCADFLNLKKDIDIFIHNHIDYLHVDIMDGHYVPNFTLGIDFCRALSKSCIIPLDIHLMIENVDAYVQDFASLPGSIVTFHPEIVYHPLRTIQTIKKHGAKAGIAIDPALPVESIKHLLPEVDMLCVMTVNPGYAGQTLIPHIIEKLREVVDYIRQKDYNIEIEVDGNVSWENIPLMLDAGAEVLVAGTSSLFDKKADLAQNITRLRDLLQNQTVKPPRKGPVTIMQYDLKKG
jgi:ribulose-phosphate 3-epimerase